MFSLGNDAELHIRVKSLQVNVQCSQWKKVHQCVKLKTLFAAVRQHGTRSSLLVQEEGFPRNYV